MDETTYHHGDLRAALLDAAEDDLQADPGAALSVRSLAGKVGVSATAPHAHFRTRADLLAALASRGFERLRQELAAVSQAEIDPQSALVALAECYIAFGARNAGLYRLMFTTGVGLTADPELRQTSRGSFDALRDAVRRAFPDQEEAAINQTTLTAWALVHGFGSLSNEGRISEEIAPDQSPAAFARIAAALLVQQADQK